MARTGFLNAVLVALLVFCITPPVAAAPLTEEGVHKLYEDGLRLFHSGQHKKAVAIFDKIEALYPFSQMAIDGSLVAAVSHYELGNYAEAASLAESYIDAYPSSKNIDYAYYVRVTAKYMQVPDLGLDQGVALEVRNLASEFVRMFPNSRYLAEVSQRLAAVQQHLAAREFMIGDFYLRRGGFIAAIKRFNSLVSGYPDSVYAHEGLYRLVEAYTALGDRQSAAMYLSRLGENSPWRVKAERLLDRGNYEELPQAEPEEATVVEDNQEEGAVEAPMPSSGDNGLAAGDVEQ
ncbi:putative DNA uptake lipoprotein ComL [Anaplasma centrale str. Israel]|uniref:Outer membrane protein assembly factor BamD n=1 Tax=Anaplasma centrale (strain Israel) TaxID=574556 RepID=D1ATW3_ANACI|nr:outer membrane protein assembly factor BamD [Anaplasma centrale]ACZ48991.1 putative DNA uptake lipoprotein ComL [Anaplasma centrale str. Israel]